MRLALQDRSFDQRNPPQVSKGLIAGLKGNQWLLITPDHKALYIPGGDMLGGGG